MAPCFVASSSTMRLSVKSTSILPSGCHGANSEPLRYGKMLSSSGCWASCSISAVLSVVPSRNHPKVSSESTDHLLSSIGTAARTVAQQQQLPVNPGFSTTTNKSSHNVNLLKFLVPSIAAAVLAVSQICYPPASIAQIVDIQKGGTLFSRSCIGCHDAGGNIIQPGATLFSQDLTRNGVDTEEEIYHLTYYGKGRMPGFGEKCSPRGQCTFGPRLGEDEIKLLAQFVKLQAEQGWTNIEVPGE